MKDRSDGVLKEAIAAFPAMPPLPQPVHLGEFLTMTIPVRRMLLGPWLPEKGLAMIVGPRGLGKTFVALNVGLLLTRPHSMSGDGRLRLRPNDQMARPGATPTKDLLHKCRLPPCCEVS